MHLHCSLWTVSSNNKITKTPQKLVQIIVRKRLCFGEIWILGTYVDRWWAVDIAATEVSSIWVVVQYQYQYDTVVEEIYAKDINYIPL